MGGFAYFFLLADFHRRNMHRAHLQISHFRFAFVPCFFWLPSFSYSTDTIICIFIFLVYNGCEDSPLPPHLVPADGLEMLSCTESSHCDSNQICVNCACAALCEDDSDCAELQVLFWYDKQGLKSTHTSPYTVWVRKKSVCTTHTL